MKTYGSIHDIKIEPEPDGSHVIVVHDFGGEPFEVLVQPDEVATILGLLQAGAMKRADQRTPQFPQYTISDIGLGFQGKIAGLLVTTVEAGTLALRGPIEMFQKIGAKADEAIKFLRGDHH
jgi:hypothetical protein